MEHYESWLDRARSSYIIKESMKLTVYAVQTRYPGEYDEITQEEYEKSLKIAKDCLDWTENKIKEEENKKVMNTVND